MKRFDPETINESQVPVTSFERGDAHKEMLSVSMSQPVSSAATDAQSVAIPLRAEVKKYLTPTMAKFTLFGKIAVITG